MGLDQSLHYIDKEFEGEYKDTDEDIPSEEIAYWRKHNRLQGWMENLWCERGNQIGEFNCERLFLTKEDIERLSEDIVNRNLPYTQGFFFGSDSYEYLFQDDMLKKDLGACADALDELSKGNRVYYTCWY
jgi:hypothetical protein